jgi:predicted dehydrogenase
MEKLQIGFVGAGGIVRDRHYPGLKDRDDVELAAVCNSTPESTARAAAEFSIPKTCESWQELVQVPDLDIIWIGTTPHLHREITLAALNAGKHVFCQARMAMNLAEAKEMLACARAHPQLVTMLCPPPQGMKYGHTFKKLLDQGVIGEPYHLQLQANNLVWQDSDRPLHWRQDITKSGMNILSVGIFAEVLGYWVGYPASLLARTKIARKSQAGADVQVPDVVHVMAQWKSGWLGVLQWSGVAAGTSGPRLECYGSKGSLVYDFGNGEKILHAQGAGPLEVVDVAAADQGGWDVENRFIEAVKSGGSLRPEPTFETGVKYMDFIEAVQRSSKAGTEAALAVSTLH